MRYARLGPSSVLVRVLICDKGKGRPLGELKATFSTALKVMQCSKTIMSYDQSQCVLLALCVCGLGRGLTEKVLGLGQRRGGGWPPPSEGGGGFPFPPYSPPNCRTPLGVTHWLAAAPVPLVHYLSALAPKGAGSQDALSSRWLHVLGQCGVVGCWCGAVCCVVLCCALLCPVLC